MLKIFHSDRFVPQLPSGHRFPISKYQLIREQLLYEGIVHESQLEESYACAEEDILAVHTDVYWNQMKTQQLDPRAARKIGFPQSTQLTDRSRRSCQGTLSASLHALKYGIGMNIAGGTHHAYADHGEGFCLLNDLAITAQYVFTHNQLSRILIVDLDVHQGNGSAHIFQNDDRVYTFSMHGADNYPLQKEQSDLDIALPTGKKDKIYLQLLHTHLPKLIENHKPELILYQAGVDILASDKLGKLSVSPQGCKERDRYVLDLCAKKEIPIAVAMGGGYSHKLADTVNAHTNTFRVAMGIFG